MSFGSWIAVRLIDGHVHGITLPLDGEWGERRPRGISAEMSCACPTRCHDGQPWTAERVCTAIPDPIPRMTGRLRGWGRAYRRHPPGR